VVHLGGGASIYRGPPARTAEEAERVFKTTTDEVKAAHTRNVFISFHVEDESQVNLLREQAKSDRYDIDFRDYSVKEPFDEKWKTECRERISQTSVTVCMIGEKTAEREAVIWELEESYRQGKKVIGVKIHKDKDYPIPRPLVENNAPIVEWDLKKISRLLEESDKNE
jgi:hypothetical protein